MAYKIPAAVPTFPILYSILLNSIHQFHSFYHLITFEIPSRVASDLTTDTQLQLRFIPVFIYSFL